MSISLLAEQYKTSTEIFRLLVTALWLANHPGRLAGGTKVGYFPALFTHIN